MSNSPNPINKSNLTRATVAGVALSIFGVVMFIVLWVVLGNAGVADAPRLLSAMCVPPLLIILILGGYVLMSRRGSES